MPRIFITHPPTELAGQYGDKALAGLRALGEVRLNTAGRELAQDELIAAAQGCDVIVSYRQTPATAQLFASLPQLKALCRCAVDIRNIDIPSASECGVLVTHASAGFIPAVAEWVLAAMVDLSRSITASTEAYHAGRIPSLAAGRELHRSTLGVLGYGQISRYLCGIATALGMEVLVTDPYAKADGPGIRQVGFDELLGKSDFLVALAIASAQTENIFDAKAFAKMKAGAYFINAARGNLVDEEALRHALDHGPMAGCAMDVGRAPDNMPTPGLAAHPKVIATPHVGAFTPGSVEHQALETVRQVAAILQGQVPEGALNAEHAKRLGAMKAEDPHTPDCAGFKASIALVPDRLPQGTCDTHFHLFGPYAKYPLAAKRGYTPPEATLADYRRLCDAVGIERAVLVQPSNYGTDLSQMLDVLRNNSSWMRGVAMLDPSVTDARLRELHEAGVRGFRLNYALGAGMPIADARALADRVQPLGWHVVMLFDLSTRPDFYAEWKDFPVNIVVDHMGQMPVSHGVDAPGFQGLLRSLREGRMYVKLSGVARFSALPFPHEDTLPFARALVDAHPERLLWGTDWPHPLVKPTPDDGELASLVARWLPTAELRERALVSNPARLYGFEAK